MRSGAAAGLAVLAGLATAAAADTERRYGVGREATPEEIGLRDLSVLPTGAGLPEGWGTAQAGRPLYEARCAPCHGPKGEGVGDDYPPLAGGQGSLASKEPLLTVGSYWPYATTVFDYIRRAMPYDDLGALSPDLVYAITAYVLRLNGIVAEGGVLDRQTLPAVRMPNRDGFMPDPRPDVGAPGGGNAKGEPPGR
ncbi:MAG TPA: cytochrome c [Polyangiaceae bacterium]|nr:cytochrome c [Polyangiaceae bacterium]